MCPVKTRTDILPAYGYNVVFVIVEEAVRHAGEPVMELKQLPYLIDIDKLFKSMAGHRCLSVRCSSPDKGPLVLHLLLHAEPESQIMLQSMKKTKPISNHIFVLNRSLSGNIVNLPF
jgi:hypothetical protein